jgi:cell division protein FtsW (lipid II flippase)
MMNFIIFALLMQDSVRLFDKRNLLYWAALGAGVLTTVATLSRGGIATMIAGCAIVVMLSFLLRQGPAKIKKKFAALGLMFLLSIPVLFVVLPKVIERFESAPVESGESRQVANLASKDMGDDYFFGVGLNNYSYAINYMPYGEDLAKLDRGIAHHIFWLHYAELGILGVISYILLTGTFIWIALRFILKRRDSLERVFAIGIFTAFVINWLIGTLEWNFRIIQITLAYFMLAGFVTSLDRIEQRRIRKNKSIKYQLAHGRRPTANPATLRRRHPHGTTSPVRGRSN